MCFILCCCCNLCNTYSSKCIEITILILSFTSFSASIIGYIFVNKEHTPKEAYGCLIVVIISSIILMLSIILILIWRFRELINNTRNTAASTFSKIGLVTTIFCILFTGIWESMSISKFYDLNYPCQIKESNTLRQLDKINLINILLKKNKRYLLTYEENKEEFCLENPKYNAKIVSTLEYIFLFVSSTILEIILLVLLYFWYNDFRRIKYLVDGKLIDSNTKENKTNYDKKKKKYNNNLNLMFYGQNDYVAHYDIYGRPLFNLYKKKSKVVNIKHFPKIIEQNRLKENINNEKNKNKIDIGKIVCFENNSSERANIYNLKCSKIKNNINSNILSLNVNSNLNKINENENSTFNNIK